MKILDRYILTSYLKTFISVFLILMLIFVLQTIWLYIKELAGKDLDLGVVFKFLFYMMPKLIPLVLPLTILLASIMVFGNFAENYEFAAMKSTGISLQRAMSGLSVFIVILGFTTFLFSNNVIPWAEYNSYNLRKNIAKLKPAMLLAKGQFNPVGNYNIKFTDKSGERGQYLHDVIIHIKARDGRTNATTIKAKNGELVGKESSNVLKLLLFDGNYYNDILPKKAAARKKKPFAKSTFEKYIINIDLSKLNDVDIDEKSYSDKYNMLNLSGLDKAIDSLSDKYQTDYESFASTLYQRSNVTSLSKKLLSGKGTDTEQEEVKITIPDSLYSSEILDFFETTSKLQIVNIALNSFNSTNQIISSKEVTTKAFKSNYKRHIISFHEKLALGFACVILFFVGAPLGALIRKGGIGLPMVIAILLFLTYHFIGIFATNSAKNGNFSPILASWFSTLVMLPLGIFLTKKATADRGLFETEGVLEPLKKLFRIKKKDTEIDTSLFEPDSSEYTTLSGYDDKELIKVIKNYWQYNYSRIHRNTAVSILNSRGITNQQLKFSGNFDNQKFEEAIRLKYKFDEDSKLAFILYAIAIPLIILGRVLENNGAPILGMSLFIIGLIIGITYLFSLIKSFISSSNLAKHLGKESGTSAIVYLLFGLPLYFIFYLYQKKVTSEALYLNQKKTFSKSIENDDKIIPTKINLDKASQKLKDYKAHSLFSIILYSIGLTLIVLFFVFKNNKLPSLQSASIELSGVSFALYVIYYFKSIINIFSIYKITNLSERKPNSFLLIIGLPVYFITHILLRNKIKSDIE